MRACGYSCIPEALGLPFSVPPEASNGSASHTQAVSPAFEVGLGPGWAFALGNGEGGKACSSVHGILQARILEWVAISSRGNKDILLYMI